MKNSLYLPAIFLLLIVFNASTLGEVTVQPFGFIAALDEGDTLFDTLTIINSGQQARNFNIKFDESRDDLGDVIAQFRRPNGPGNGYCGGIAWDWNNEWIWLTELETQNPARIMAVDPSRDYQVVVTANTPGQMMDAAWHDGVLYCVNWSNNWLFRFDEEGRNLGNLNFQFRPTGCDASQENDWLFVMDDAAPKNIRVFDIANDFREIGTIDTYQQFVNNQLTRTFVWVDKHPQGQLWMVTGEPNNGQLLIKSWSILKIGALPNGCRCSILG